MSEGAPERPPRRRADTKIIRAAPEGVYDVVVAGGSISGLLCAREVARGGFSVLVLEEDHEVGTPEHCSGLVSGAGLGELGIVPSHRTWGCAVGSAEIFAPGGGSVVLDAGRQNVVEVSRRELDKQAARQAQAAGAAIRVGTRVTGMGRGAVRTRGGEVGCRVAVDARGVSSLVRRDPGGILASAQCEICADWIPEDRVQIFFDQEKYPKFFAWVISSGERGGGKAGAAGEGINAAGALDGFLRERGGGHSVIRMISAPIWVNGPIENFVEDGVVIVGDAAGQTKPTTAGGIYTAGMGGVLAGRAIAGHLRTGDPRDVEAYQEEWGRRFGRQFETQLAARRALGALDNGTLDRLFGAVTPEMAARVSEMGDFDFHAAGLWRALGTRDAARVLGPVVGGRIRGWLGRAREGGAGPG